MNLALLRGLQFPNDHRALLKYSMADLETNLANTLIGVVVPLSHHFLRRASVFRRGKNKYKRLLREEKKKNKQAPVEVEKRFEQIEVLAGELASTNDTLRGQLQESQQLLKPARTRIAELEKKCEGLDDEVKRTAKAWEDAREKCEEAEMARDFAKERLKVVNARVAKAEDMAFRNYGEGVKAGLQRAEWTFPARCHKRVKQAFSRFFVSEAFDYIRTHLSFQDSAEAVELVLYQLQTRGELREDFGRESVGLSFDHSGAPVDEASPSTGKPKEFDFQGNEFKFAFGRLEIPPPETARGESSGEEDIPMPSTPTPESWKERMAGPSASSDPEDGNGEDGAGALADDGGEEGQEDRPVELSD